VELFSLKLPFWLVPDEHSGLCLFVQSIITLAFANTGSPMTVAAVAFPGQAFLSGPLLLIYMVPSIVLVIPLLTLFFSQLGLLRNSLTGLLIVLSRQKQFRSRFICLQGLLRGAASELERRPV